MTKPSVHGRDHAPGGPDCLYAGEWVYVGSGDPIPGCGWWDTSNDCIDPDTGNPGPCFNQRYAPGFQGTWENQGSGKVPVRFRLILGPYNTIDRTGTTAVHHAHKVLEVQGSAIGGEEGSLIFSLPPEFVPSVDYAIPLHAHDNEGNYRAWHMEPGGDFYDGA